MLFPFTVQRLLHKFTTINTIKNKIITIIINNSSPTKLFNEEYIQIPLATINLLSKFSKTLCNQLIGVITNCDFDHVDTDCFHNLVSRFKTNCIIQAITIFCSTCRSREGKFFFINTAIHTSTICRQSDIHT